ncbi:MAG: class I SAM-dependent methyltransferase [Planctomycetota bacterium]|jgi:SAM-dependent methyltransferase
MFLIATGCSARKIGLALTLCGLAACGSDRGTEALQEPEAEAAGSEVPEPPPSEELEAVEVEAGEVAEPDPDADPGPGVDVYMGREVAQTMHWLGAEWLLRDTREDEEHVEELLGCLGVEAGDVVCDFGSGVGVHALPLAGLVGETGKVIAVDIQPQMLRMLEDRAAEAGITGIETVSNGPASTGLAPDSVDLILLVDVYHELSHPEPVLAGLRRSLKNGGRVALVEFRGEDPAVPIKPEHKMTREQARLEWEANGFALVGSYDELPWQHVLFFEVAEDS